MQTLLVAIVGGIVGTVLAALIAVAARFLRAQGDVVTHDRLVAERDEDLASWVSDRTLALRRDISATTEELNKENLFYGGAHANAVALVKEQALHQYRDELRRVERAVAALREAEGRTHDRWRRRDTRPFPTLRTPAKSEPILDAWRSAITRHGGGQVEVVDLTRRDLDDALARLRAEGAGDYV